MAGEIGARLHHLGLGSPQPGRLARFYAESYGAAGTIHAVPGAAGRLAFAAFAFPGARALEAHRRRVRVPVREGGSPVFGAGSFSVADPDGNVIVFGVESGPRQEQARLQHFATRSARPEALLAFYRDELGFVCSDRVHDDAGALRACFLRTDEEHHALAVFHAAEPRHDHLSFETTGWAAVRDWADRFAARGIEIVWGVGRHGPGNDVFFMVRDPDGNLAEISAELERVAPGRPEGRWRHEPRTLNLWGQAIMRS